VDSKAVKEEDNKDNRATNKGVDSNNGAVNKWAVSNGVDSNNGVVETSPKIQASSSELIFFI